MEIKNAEKFTLVRFRFYLRPRGKIYLPRYKGSTLRGGLGSVFKQTVCVGQDKECPGCLLQERCTYAYIFETPLPREGKNTSKFNLPYSPHPFVLEPPLTSKTEYSPEEEIVFDLVLLGRGIDYLPYFIFVFEELGRKGIGRSRGKYELIRVESEEGERIYQSGKFSTAYQIKSLQGMINETEPEKNCRKVTINFLTPTRIVLKGRLTRELNFQLFLTNLLRRISWLSQFHNDKELEFDYKYLISQAERIKTEAKDFQWYDWERYSSRQNLRMKLGGFVGRILYEGDLKEFLPFLKLGEYLHLGKGTSFGLGKYKITT